MSTTDRHLARQMEEIVATGVSTYVYEFTKEIFNEYTSSESQDTIVRGIAAAIVEYQKRTGVPIAQTLAYTLLDYHKAAQQ